MEKKPKRRMRNMKERKEEKEFPQKQVVGQAVVVVISNVENVWVLFGE